MTPRRRLPISWKDADYAAKKYQFIFGGDGWAYDIGFGGLDHVIASNENVNIVVFDTEVYSNTGGQASKATQTGAVAKFAASGKVVKKKDLGADCDELRLCVCGSGSYGRQCQSVLKGVQEAAAYDGPSIIICYAPCINHGIKMPFNQAEQKKAVAAGYWNLFRFNPDLAKAGKNPFNPWTARHPAPIMYSSSRARPATLLLKRSFPGKAEKLFSIAAENSIEKYNKLAALVDFYAPKGE